MSLSNTFLIDMTAAANALGDRTATYAATSTMAAPGLAIGFAAATAVAQDAMPRTSADMSFPDMRCPSSTARRCTACSEARQRLRPKGIYPMNL